MRRIRKGWNEFWAETTQIRLKELLAGPAELAEAYRKEAEFLQDVLGLSQGRTVLDLGCGAGEHCLALARKGIRATGIDIAPALVEYARRRCGEPGLPATFLSADMRTFRTEARFDAVFTSSGTFGLFESAADNRSVLRTIRAALADGGRFLIGPSGPGLLARESFSEKDWFLTEEGCLLREISWDRTTSLFCEKWLCITEKGTLVEFGGFDGASDGQRSRVYSLEALQEMIQEERLVFTAAYGSFNLPPRPYGADTPRLLIAGRKR